MVGTKVSRPQTRALKRASGALSRARPSQVSKNTVVADSVMPASQPPRAILHWSSRRFMVDLAGRGVAAISMRRCAAGSSTINTAKSPISSS